MEILIQLAALALTLLLAVIKSLRYAPIGPSDFELSRQAEAGSEAAVLEWRRRGALPTLVALQYIKEIIISVVIAVLLFGFHGPVLGSLLAGVYFFLAYLLAVRGWVGGLSRPLQKSLEPILIKVATALKPVLGFMTAKDSQAAGASVASRGELVHLIDADKQVLSPEDKQRLKGALAFGTLKIKDVMVPRDNIATVEVDETVGPVLLDRLHKEGHKIFVAVKRNLDHIEGLLYMSDATSGHPDLKKVKDGVRKSILYLPEDEELLTVLGASLQSGKQLFIVVDNQGNTTGLISLRDALAKLLGIAPPAENLHVSNDPKKVD
jgi:CBS domain containing-hemolysin-like protein